MKNRSAALIAATAMMAVAATMPAKAGYTIYTDTAMPSVLFVEFDKIAGEDVAAVGPDDGPLVIRAPGGDVDVIEPEPRSRSVTGDGSSQSVTQRSRRSSSEIDRDRVRDVFIDEAIRERIRDGGGPFLR